MYMAQVGKMLVAIAAIIAGVAALAPGPGASSEHFVIVNDNDYYGNSQGNNFGTILKLAGTKQNPALEQVASLATGEPSVTQGSLVPTVQVVREGSDTCVFLADSAGARAATPNEISSFLYPSGKEVGSYSDSNVTSPELSGIIIVAQNGYLFAAYDGYDNGNQVSNYMATWKINAGCTLTLFQTYQLSDTDAVFSMAATPDGKTLVASYEHGGVCCIGSFSIGHAGTLTEHGPYYVFDAATIWGMDITADSKYAIFNIAGNCQPHPVCHTQININPINPDGSLGDGPTFGGDGSLGTAHAGGWVRLSPDERFLFTTDDWDEVTTLNFTESPLNVTYSGCLTELKIPNGEPSVISQAIATAGRSGAGRAIYVAETASVALLAVNEKTGCTTEASSSPFLIPDVNVNSASLVAWPPRGF